jgi:hypothetical protein
VVLHRHILALDVAGFVEALAERGGKGRIGRSGIDKSDDRHPRLLRTRGERPRGCSAAERGQKFSSSNVACHVTLQLGVIHAMEG